MKNRQWNKLTTNKCKQFCNEWCCPCNDGSTGCYANDFYEMLCDNSTTAHIFRGEEDLFDRLQEESYDKMVESYDDPEIYEKFCEKFVDELCEKNEEKPKTFWELLVETYNKDNEKLDELYPIDSEEESEPMPICNDKNAAMPYETSKVNCTVDGYIPIEWLKTKTIGELCELLEEWDKENEQNKENTFQTD